MMVDLLEEVVTEEREEVLEEKLGEGRKRRRDEEGKGRKRGLNGLPERERRSWEVRWEERW
jgi:hypothetical protein